MDLDSDARPKIVSVFIGVVDRLLTFGIGSLFKVFR